MRSARFPSRDGIGPLNAFPQRDSRSRFTRLPSRDGIGPLNAFRSRFSRSRFASLPNAAGIGPLNRFELRFSPRRFTRLPNAAGIGPVNALPGPRSSDVTRPSTSVVTPYHSPSGADVFQLVPFVQLGPPVES